MLPYTGELQILQTTISDSDQYKITKERPCGGTLRPISKKTPWELGDSTLLHCAGAHDRRILCTLPGWNLCTGPNIDTTLVSGLYSILTLSLVKHGGHLKGYILFQDIK
jgi:hypothetical protein